jgi:hypothetical protein
MPNPTCIRVVAADVPRDTLKALLSQCRNNRRGKIQLTGLSPDGHYYAVFENQAIADTFMGVLTRMTIRHDEVDATSVNIQDTPPKPRATAPTGEYPWFGNLGFDKPFNEWLDNLFPPRPGSSA